MFKSFSIVCIALFLSVTSMSSYGQNPSPPDLIGETELVYYYRGKSKVQVQVALDELNIQGANHRSFTAPSIGRGESIRPSGSRSSLLRFNPSVSTMGNLNAKAKSYGASDRRVQGVAYPKGHKERSIENRRILTNTIALKLSPTVSLDSLENQYGFSVMYRASYDPDTYIVSVESDDVLAALDMANAMHESGDVDFAELVTQQYYSMRFTPNDPLYSSQWHLNNVNKGAYFTDGNDANITSAWDEVTGDGINILILDEGINVAHEDLAANARTDLDYDFIDDDDSPLPGQWHGTASSGIALAVGNNSTGVTGAAYEASLVGIRLFDASYPPENDIADALSHLVDETIVADQAHVNNNSWGPTDHPAYKDQLSSIVASALANGTSTGRNGKGVIYVWAGGNGRLSSDRSTYDPFTSSRHTIAVGASGGNGRFSSYSEPGPCLLVNAPSEFSATVGNSTSTFRTTTTNITAYTSSFGGTSSASPLVAGVVALILEKNSALTWRDVQQILVETSTETDLKDQDWIINGAGHLYNENYGFGRINAQAAIDAAEGWTNLPAELTPLEVSESSLALSIPDNNLNGLTRELVMSPGSAFSVEHVELTVDISHTSRGNLQISLISPDGTESIFTKTHSDTVNNYSNWTFTSVAHWGENPAGTWTVKIVDGVSTKTGTLNSWGIKLYGTSPTATIPDNSTVYVDSTFKGYEQGTALQPFNTLGEATAHLNLSGVLNVYPELFVTSPTLLFNRPMTINVTAGGTATIE